MRHMGQHFRQLMAERHLTQAEVAEKCDMTKQWVFEMCKSEMWLCSNVYRIADALQIDPRELLPR